MTIRRLSIWIALAVLSASALLWLGCAFGEIDWTDPLKRRFTLEDAHRNYTEYVRWSAFDKASRYVEPEVREEYLSLAPSLQELRFTDYELNPVEIDEETGEATLEVTYLAYQPNSAVEIPIKETQHWRRRGAANNWLVTPSFSNLPPLLSDHSEH